MYKNIKTNYAYLIAAVIIEDYWGCTSSGAPSDRQNEEKLKAYKCKGYFMAGCAPRREMLAGLYFEALPQEIPGRLPHRDGKELDGGK